MPEALTPPPSLLADLRQLIESARQRAAASVNAELTLLYWRVGQRIGAAVLRGERAEYGAAVMEGLARQLVGDYGRGFEVKSLRRMVQFAQAYPDEAIVATLSRQLSWSHLKELLPLGEP